ncbi:hypothetical protein CVT25_014712, partial [Psilocybe cyanescens]
PSIYISSHYASCPSQHKLQSACHWRQRLCCHVAGSHAARARMFCSWHSTIGEQRKAAKRALWAVWRQIEWVVVNDITKEGVFDEFVRDVDAIEHTASPVSPKNPEDPQDYIRPAVQGTLSVLTSAMKFGYAFPALLRTVNGLTILDEKDWDDEFVKAAEELGTKADGILKYLASETLSERDSSTWQDTRNMMFSLRPDLYISGVLPRGNPELKSEILLVLNSQKVQNILGIEYKSLEESTLATLGYFWGIYKWDIRLSFVELVVINPAQAVLDPSLLDSKAVSEVTHSVELWYKYMTTDQPDETLQGGYNYIVVRDLADTQKKEAAGGGRVILFRGMCMLLLTIKVLSL